MVGAIGETLGTLPPVLVPSGLTGAITPKPILSKTPKSKNISISSLDGITSDRVKKSFQKKLGDDRFEPRIFGMVKKR